MSGAVDVLAVMDERIRQAASRWKTFSQDDGPEPPSIIEFREARAAVAELIERAECLCRTGEGMIQFRAALVRVGGVA